LHCMMFLNVKSQHYMKNMKQKKIKKFAFVRVNFSKISQEIISV